MAYKRTHHTDPGRPKHLGIVSDAEHYADAAGRLYCLGPVVRQFEEWASLFDQVTVCAPLLSGAVPSTHIPYTTDRVSLLPVQRAGGNTWMAKLVLAAAIPAWWRSVRQLFSMVDAVHIRCPNNISIVALLESPWMPRHRQAVYTGSWDPYAGEPLTYRWQRWFLARWFKGPVAVYTEPSRASRTIVPSFSPALTHLEWQAEGEGVERRIRELLAGTRLNGSVRLASVGSLSVKKNHQAVIHAVRLLITAGIDTELTIVGGGALHDRLHALAGELGISDRVRLTGAVPHDTVRAILRESDFHVLASRAEGYGKVTIESLACGAIPIASDVGLSRVLLADGDRGRLFHSDDAQAICDHVQRLVANPIEMARLIENGRRFTAALTMESWREHIREMLEESWGVTLAVATGATR